MKLFGQVVRTVVNTALLPVAVAKDVYEVATGYPPGHSAEAIERLKREASEEPPR